MSTASTRRSGGSTRSRPSGRCFPTVRAGAHARPARRWRALVGAVPIAQPSPSPLPLRSLVAAPKESALMLNEAAQPARRRHVQAMRSALEQARGSLPAVPSRAPFGADSAALGCPRPLARGRLPLPSPTGPRPRPPDRPGECGAGAPACRAARRPAGKNPPPKPPFPLSPLLSPLSPLQRPASPRAAATGGDRRGGRVLVQIPADRRGVRAVAGRPARDLDARSRAASARICTPTDPGQTRGASAEYVGKSGGRFFSRVLVPLVRCGAGPLSWAGCRCPVGSRIRRVILVGCRPL